MYAYVIKCLVLGWTARVVLFVCIIPAITQTVATVWFKLMVTETDLFCQRTEFNSINDNDNGNGKNWKTETENLDW